MRIVIDFKYYALLNLRYWQCDYRPRTVPAMSVATQLGIFDTC